MHRFRNETGIFDTFFSQRKQPNKFLKNYRKYSPESLMKIYEIVKRKRIPGETAAHMICVPAQTLRDRINGNVDPRSCRVGPETVLTSSQEGVLAPQRPMTSDFKGSLSQILSITFIFLF